MEKILQVQKLVTSTIEVEDRNIKPYHEDHEIPKHVTAHLSFFSFKNRTAS